MASACAATKFTRAGYEEASHKVLKKEGENTKVSLRNVRRNINTSVNNLEKEKKISKDFERDYIIEIQVITDKYIKVSEEIINKKIAEISEV